MLAFVSISVAMLGCADGAEEEVAFAEGELFPVVDVELAGGETMADCFEAWGAFTITSVTATAGFEGAPSAILMRDDGGVWVLDGSAAMADEPDADGVVTATVDWIVVEDTRFCVAVGNDEEWVPDVGAPAGSFPEEMSFLGTCIGQPIDGEGWICEPGGANWAHPISVGLTWHDEDGDGFLSYEDCDDSDAALGSRRNWFPDADGDGVGTGDGQITHVSCENPGPGWSERDDDCDDDDYFAAESGSVFCPTESGSIQVTCCEVSAAWVVLPFFALWRRRRG